MRADGDAVELRTNEVQDAVPVTNDHQHSRGCRCRRRGAPRGGRLVVPTRDSPVRHSEFVELIQAETGMKRRTFSSFGVRSFEKSPKCDSGCFFALFLVLVVLFWSDLKFLKNFCFLFSDRKQKTRTNPTKKEPQTRKSLRFQFSYAPIRVKIGPHRQ